MLFSINKKTKLNYFERKKSFFFLSFWDRELLFLSFFYPVFGKDMGTQSKKKTVILKIVLTYNFNYFFYFTRLILELELVLV